MNNEGKITWDEAVRCLENSTAIIFEDTVTYFNKQTDKKDEIIFLYHRILQIFTKENNKEITIAGASLYLTSNTKEEMKITILQPVHISTLLRNN